MNKILVPVDFSITSANALRLACAIAAHYNAAVHLLHVADSDEDLGKPDVHERSHDFAGSTKKLREFGRAVAAAYKINCICATEYGSVTHIILKKAKQLHPDLIIMGKNGSNGPSGLFAGTHTCQVAKKSDTPVLIVPGQTVRPAFNQVLLPLRPLTSMTGKYYRMRPFIVKDKAFITILSLHNPVPQNEFHATHALTELIKNKLQLDGLAYTIEHYKDEEQFAETVLMESGNPEKKYDLTIIIADYRPTQEPFRFSVEEQVIIHHTKTPLLLLHGSETFVQDGTWIQFMTRNREA